MSYMAGTRTRTTTGGLRFLLPKATFLPKFPHNYKKISFFTFPKGKKGLRLKVALL
jgi:hypothetical protein